MNDKCKANERLLPNGKCERCAPYLKAGGHDNIVRGNFFSKCVQTECAADQINAPNGECKKCSGKTLPNSKLPGQPDREAYYNTKCIIRYCTEGAPNLDWKKQECTDSDIGLHIDGDTDGGKVSQNTNGGGDGTGDDDDWDDDDGSSDDNGDDDNGGDDNWDDDNSLDDGGDGDN